MKISAKSVTSSGPSVVTVDKSHGNYPSPLDAALVALFEYALCLQEGQDSTFSMDKITTDAVISVLCEHLGYAQVEELTRKGGLVDKKV